MNTFVNTILYLLLKRSVVKGPIIIQPPEKTATPYGGRLTWIMPGHTRMVVHMKDKNKMRHRKRWSQVGFVLRIIGKHLIKASFFHR